MVVRGGGEYTLCFTGRLEYSHIVWAGYAWAVNGRSMVNCRSMGGQPLEIADVSRMSLQLLCHKVTITTQTV